MEVFFAWNMFYSYFFITFARFLKRAIAIKIIFHTIKLKMIQAFQKIEYGIITRQIK